MTEDETLVLLAGGAALLWLTSQNTTGNRSRGRLGRQRLSRHYAQISPSPNIYKIPTPPGGPLAPTYHMDYADRMAINPDIVPASPLTNAYDTFVPFQMRDPGLLPYGGSAVQPASYGGGAGTPLYFHTEET